MTDDTRKIVLEQVTGRWSYNGRPAVFGVYIIYEYGKNLEDVWVLLTKISFRRLHSIMLLGIIEDI